MRLSCLFGLFFLSLSTFGQSPKKVVRNLVSDPVYFVDSVQVPKADLMRYDANTIAALSVYKDTTAIRLAGEAGKYGVIYIETKPFARSRYQRYLQAKSSEYAQLIQTKKTDSTFQYILNGKPLTSNFEGDLALIDDATFKSLHILDTATVHSKYGVMDKEYGIVIESRVPHDLYKGEQKF